MCKARDHFSIHYNGRHIQWLIFFIFIFKNVEVVQEYTKVVNVSYLLTMRCRCGSLKRICVLFPQKKIKEVPEHYIWPIAFVATGVDTVVLFERQNYS
jgi:hypothetical protein